MTSAPSPGRSRASWISLVAAGAVLLLAFALVTSLYSAEGRLTQSGQATTNAANSLTATLTPIAIRPATSTATARLAFHWIGDDLVDEDGRLGDNTRVTVLTGTGVSETRYPAGTVPSSIEVELAVDGEQSAYPFDHYDSAAQVIVDHYELLDDGSVRSAGPVPLALSTASGVSGWNTDAAFTDVEGAHVASFRFTRAFSTQAFAMLILVMSAILAILALTVGVLTKTRRRVAEATLLSWSAALIFALPALRNFMPNAPPIGAAIDVYVFLWIMVAAVTAAVLVILAWIERDRVDGRSGGAA